MIEYRVLPEPHTHLYHVRLTVPAPAAEGQVLALPAWIPGSYMIRDFAKNILRIAAQDGYGSAVELEKLDKQSWRAEPCAGPLVVDYQVYAWDLSVRGAHLDTTHAYFNGTSLFLNVAGQGQAPVAVELLPPQGIDSAGWRVATTLSADGAGPEGFGRYCAADYDELVDHPVEMGRFTLERFDACGVPHAVAITGRQRSDGARLARDLKKICEYQIRLFGEPAPVQQYLFQVMAVGEGYGGLEHRSSTSLLCSRNDLPRPGQEELSEEYRSFLGLCSHEYFHTWNVKRIKPAEFVPYALDREVHTTLLWAFEGFTAYYDDLVLVRTGLISPASYLELLGQSITRVLRSGGRHVQSAAESSFDAWTKFYKADENAPNAIVSYYVKGALIALVLDLTLRDDSRDARSLDDVMRLLWERHGKTGRGITEADLVEILSEVGERDFAPLVQALVHGTEDPDLAPLFQRLGIAVHLRPAESGSDKGGKPAKNEAALARRAVLGVRTGEDPQGARLLNVFDGGAARLAGLAPGDVVIAVDGLRASHGNLEKLLSAYAPGDRVNVHAFRRDELMEHQAELQAPPADTCYFSLRDDAAEEQLAARKAWLG